MAKEKPVIYLGHLSNKGRIPEPSLTKLRKNTNNTMYTEEVTSDSEDEEAEDELKASKFHYKQK